MPAPHGDRLRAQFETTLKPRLEALEGTRLQFRRVLLKTGLLIVPLFVLFGLSDTIAAWLGIPDIIAAVGAFGLLFVAMAIAAVTLFMPGFAAKANYRARFKRDIVSEVYRIVAPSAEYEPFKSVSQAAFDAPGLFNPRGSYWSDDRLRGRIGGTPFEAGEVRRQFRTGTRQRSSLHSVFEGLFFHFGCPRTLNGTTIVQPSSAGGYQVGDRSALTRLSTGDAAFDKAFTVYSTHEDETRGLLTAPLREGIAAVQQRTGHPVFVAFKANRAYLGVHYGGALFEPSVLRATSLETLEQMAEQFTLAEAIAHALELDTRAADATVDVPLLPADDTPPHLLNAPHVVSGTLTEQELWKLAMGAMDGVSDADEPAPRPATTNVDVQHDSSRSTIAYGLPLSFFVQVVVSLLCGVVVLYALRALEWRPSALAAITDLLDTRPSAVAVGDLVGRFPLVALVAAGLAGAFVTFMWTTRVRRVVIDHDAVHVYRGLRPLPRRYTRPSYERIVQVDRAVHVGKTGSAGLLNPSASPILQSAEEARWVAAEMRRALRQMPADRQPA